ncbi:CDP-glycerol glycerophosphotransferase family protein [Glycomyces harbinensis]|uniref:CDP-Glycerol:Poly(Glycerophosphate) glycerophosphotransferase n=1 Tax=Glycomyces harbinensis TaxID=58114 RepID=A0A1G6V043_9ACTN|nr:CDP-glycerol glycerophosphotransferase family protein [Glycomyces harbinensis]SDD46235.1 CDP-Glycerol:Poly(glycerophosphate) glycerophosphotransferase [Glycomyces harbinensis]
MKNLLKSWSIRLNLLAFAAVATAVALPDLRWVPLALSLAVFAVVPWQFGGAVASVRIARTLTALSVLICAWGAGGLERWPLLAAGLMVTLFIAYADIVARALNVGFLETVNLGVTRTRRQRWTAPAVVGGLVNGLAVLYALAAFAAGPAALATDLVLLAASLAVFGWTGSAVLENYLHRRRESHPVDTQVISAVRRLQPRYVVHFAGARESEYQLQMWLDYFEAVGDPYLIIIRDRYLLDGIAARTAAPIVLVPAQSVLDSLLPESVRACYYVNHAVKNAQLIKLDKYIHVQLMHGDSDKAISRSPVSLMYDRVFVAGQAGVDRYHRHGVDIPNYKFKRIGRPQLHDLQVGERARIEGSRPVVLYTPTWTGLTADVNYSSLKQGRRIVEALLKRDVTVVFRTHPYTRTNAAYQALADEIKALIAADAAQTGRAHLWGGQAETAVSLTECINAADVAISDISGTASDWLYSGRPFAMTDPKGFRAAYLEEFPLAKAAYLLDPEAANIDQVLDELLLTDSKAGVRAEVREYYLGDVEPGELIPLFAKEVKATYGHRVRKVATGESALPVERAA